jgi:excisionase family DNA binding protein
MSLADKVAADPALVLAIAAALTGTDADSLDGRLSLSVPEASEKLGISRPIIDAAVKSGELRAVYPSSRASIPVRYLKEWLYSLPDSKP